MTYKNTEHIYVSSSICATIKDKLQMKDRNFFQSAHIKDDKFLSICVL